MKYNKYKVHKAHKVHKVHEENAHRSIELRMRIKYARKLSITCIYRSTANFFPC